ncbi:MAG: hypothetical protein AAFP77_00720 [Bacteroidota bacterium]
MNTANETQSQESAITEETFRGMRKNWHSWPTHRIGEMLYAITPLTGEMSDQGKEIPSHVQRSVCFKLRKDDLDELKKGIKSKSWDYLRFHIGASAGPDQQSIIKSQPIFALFLEPMEKNSNRQDPPSEKKFYRLRWSRQWAEDSVSGLLDSELIANQTAALFCRSFCQIRSTEIGDLFEAAIETGVYRLNHFSFCSTPTDNVTVQKGTKIEDKIRKTLDGADQLCVYLGESTATTAHPYRFRPILALDQTLPESNQANDDDYPANFEFSIHCPPIC